MKRLLPLLLLPLLGIVPARAQPTLPESARLLTLRINGQAVAADTISSRFFLGEDRALRLNIVRADDPDGEGLTIIIDRFPIQARSYSFQEILSGRNRDASYRFGKVSAYSKSCGQNTGNVTITGVNTVRHWLMGTYSCQVCEAGRGGRRFTLEGTFRYPVEKE
ncbi:hypothetical protein KBK19_12805 [Microvirga sp. STR05]|uniref:DUF4402 domain-containing protein n=1 Tax=Hymenobacter duratus TaxID=2771356 RepID=A0ABR8JMZ0_9BACT|nr:hypothetical protein [Hymenobacter duratus]MBD2715914.1 hypothetical protein [Hymenobacter duratus]MBR7950828.1 hypothetical protein [Microvirga sp. STR05]